MTRGILLGLGLAVILHRLWRALATRWAPYHYQVTERPPVVYWERGAQREA